MAQTYKDVLLVDESTFKQFSLLSDNLSFEYVTPVIKLVQDETLTTLLGEDMYKEIREQVLAGTVSAAYITLLDDYITDVIIWSVMSKVQLPINIKFRNTGLTQLSDPNNTPTQLQDIQYLEQWYKNNSKIYERLLLNYLCDNSSTYPLYKPNISNIINNGCEIYFGNNKELSLYEKYDRNNQRNW